MPDKVDDRSLRDLLSELSQETGALVRKEMELARTELRGAVTTASRDAARIGAGGALAHAGFLVLLGALVLALGEAGVPLWISAGVIAITTMVIGYAVVRSGISKLQSTNFTPRQTLESLKETAKWTTKTRA